MNLSERIQSAVALARKIKSPELEGFFFDHFKKAEAKNPFFTVPNCKKSIDEIAHQFLDEEKLQSWLSSYPNEERNKTVAIIPAGNIPLVGFQDILAVFMVGYTAQVKMSAKDSVLLPMLLKIWAEIDDRVLEKIKLLDRLEDFDAVIATGSNNSNRYFERYFGKYPNLLRKNRTSVAVLEGGESKETLRMLGQDIFSYFGLGCRNVSKIYLPQDFDIKTLLDELKDDFGLGENVKYQNNYLYLKSIYLIDKVSHFDTGFLLLTESPSLFSPLTCCFIEYYTYFNLGCFAFWRIHSKDFISIVLN